MTPAPPPHRRTVSTLHPALTQSPAHGPTQGVSVAKWPLGPWPWRVDGSRTRPCPPGLPCTRGQRSQRWPATHRSAAKQSTRLQKERRHSAKLEDYLGLQSSVTIYHRYPSIHGCATYSLQQESQQKQQQHTTPLTPAARFGDHASALTKSMYSRVLHAYHSHEAVWDDAARAGGRLRLPAVS